MDNLFLLSVVYVIAVIGAIIFYFLPSVIALQRKHKRLIFITILNLLSAWTGIGWLVLLIFASVGGNKKSNIADLKTLADLKEKGLITEEEFNNKKNKILN